MGATSEVFLVTSAGAVYIPKKAPYELIIVINPLGNTNTVFLSISGTAQTTATNSAGSEPVPAGGTPGVYFLDPSNVNGVSAIAATGNTSVILKRVPFPDEAAFFDAIMGYAAASAIISALWIALSSTAVALAGSFTQANMDTVNAKTSANGLQLGSSGDFSGGGIGVGPVTKAASTVRVGGGATTMFQAEAAALYQIIGNLAYTRVQTGTVDWWNGPSATMYSGAGTDPRFKISPTAVTRYTPVAGGQISETLQTVWKVIKNAVTLNTGDLAEYDPTSGFRVQAAAAGSTNQPAGRVITGGTGDAGGTVLAEIAVQGMIAQAFLADAAGVTQGQYVYQGATTAGRLASKTTNERTLGQALQTAASGVAVDVELMVR